MKNQFTGRHCGNEKPLTFTVPIADDEPVASAGKAPGRFGGIEAES